MPLTVLVHYLPAACLPAKTHCLPACLLTYPVPCLTWFTCSGSDISCHYRLFTWFWFAFGLFLV